MEGSNQVDLELVGCTQPAVATSKNKVEDLELEEMKLRGERPTIRRVYTLLRNQDPEAYEPKLVSIGPLHHGKSNLLQMEKRKIDNIWFVTDKIFDILIDEVSSCIGQARDQYLEEIEMSDYQFAKMLVIDGCFIISVCLRFCSIRAGSVFADVPWDYALIWRDLMLLENQIPFFVLNKLYNMIAKDWYNIAYTVHGDDYPYLVSLVLKILGINLPRERYPKEDVVLHLLHLKHLSLDPRLILDECPKRFCGLLRIFDALNAKKLRDPVKMPGAKELYEVGIKFQKIKIPKEYNKDFHLKVAFRDRMLEMPWLLVNNFTDHELRNLIAFEHCAIYPRIPHHFTDYCMFLNYLINTAEDIRVLQRSGILLNLLGDDSEVIQLFNNLCKNVIFDPEQHSSTTLYREVAVLCESPHHKWLVYLMLNYFSNSWTVFLVMAAVLILFFSHTGTFFTVFPKK